MRSNLSKSPNYILPFFIERFLPKEMNDLFHQLVMDNKKSREKSDESNDILQMLIQTQKKYSTRRDLQQNNFLRLIF